jgi:CO/xanthine dehydrogenase Mo-binding subunit
VPPTGGSFGGKQDPWPFAAVGLAAYHVRQPVILSYSREESLEASPKRHPYRLKFRLGATSQGDLTGLHVRIDCNTGGYDGAGKFIPNYALTAAGGAYRWVAVDGMARSVYTNGPKSGQFRGFGTAQSTFGLECALDELIERTGDDPIEFRLRNCIKQDENTFLGYPVGDTLGYRQVLEAIRPHFLDFVQDAAAYNAAHRKDSQRRGVGVAGMWYRFGKAGSLRIETHAELASDGHFIVYCSAPDYGQGIGTVMSQIAADTLRVGRERIEIVNADTACVPNSDIQGASRATFFVGGSVVKAAEALTQSILGVAAELLDVPVAHLRIDDGSVLATGDGERSVSLVDVAAEFDRMGKQRRVPGFFDISSAFPEQARPEYVPLFLTGAHLADVLVDTETGAVDVLRMVAAHDVGRAINPVGATGQIEGAIVMGLGAALYEEYLPGQTTDLSQYQLPMIGSMPDIKVILVEVPSRWGPYGVKGLGEAPLLPSTPAIINAVSRAIGCRIRSIPATPERVLDAIYTSQGQSYRNAS